jgi:hypothetical protein
MSEQSCDIWVCSFKVNGVCTKTQEGYKNCMAAQLLFDNREGGKGT